MKLKLSTQMCWALREVVLPEMANLRDVNQPTVFEFDTDPDGTVLFLHVSCADYFSCDSLSCTIDGLGRIEYE